MVPWRQEFDAVQLAGLFLEDADELRADDLALLLRVGDARQLVQEAVDGVHIDQIGVHLVPEDLDDLLRLALAQQTVVDMDAGQLLADGLDEQRRHDGGVHAAGQRQQDLLVPHLRADQFDLVGDEVLHIPVGLGMANAEDEIRDSAACGPLHRRARRARPCGRPDAPAGRSHRSLG